MTRSRRCLLKKISIYKENGHKWYKITLRCAQPTTFRPLFRVVLWWYGFWLNIRNISTLQLYIAICFGRIIVAGYLCPKRKKIPTKDRPETTAKFGQVQKKEFFFSSLAVASPVWGRVINLLLRVFWGEVELKYNMRTWRFTYSDKNK